MTEAAKEKKNEGEHRYNIRKKYDRELPTDSSDCQPTCTCKQTQRAVAGS